jgi:hypothetical protein
VAQEREGVGVLQIARGQLGRAPERDGQDRGALGVLERPPHPEVGGERKRRQQLGTAQGRTSVGRSPGEAASARDHTP